MWLQKLRFYGCGLLIIYSCMRTTHSDMDDIRAGNSISPFRYHVYRCLNVFWNHAFMRKGHWSVIAGLVSTISCFSSSLLECNQISRSVSLPFDYGFYRMLRLQSEKASRCSTTCAHFTQDVVVHVKWVWFLQQRGKTYFRRRYHGQSCHGLWVPKGLRAVYLRWTLDI